MTGPSSQLVQQPGEPDDVFLLRQVAQSILLEEQLIPEALRHLVRHLGDAYIGHTLHAWNADAPLPDDRLDAVTKSTEGRCKA